MWSWPWRLNCLQFTALKCCQHTFSENLTKNIQQQHPACILVKTRIAPPWSSGHSQSHGYSPLPAELALPMTFVPLRHAPASKLINSVTLEVTPWTLEHATLHLQWQLIIDSDRRLVLKTRSFGRPEEWQIDVQHIYCHDLAIQTRSTCPTIFTSNAYNTNEYKWDIGSPYRHTSPLRECSEEQLEVGARMHGDAPPGWNWGNLLSSILKQKLRWPRFHEQSCKLMKD